MPWKEAHAIRSMGGGDLMTEWYRTFLVCMLLALLTTAARADCASRHLGDVRVKVAMREGAVQLAFELPQASSCLRFKSGGRLRLLNWHIHGAGRLSSAGDILQWEQPVRSFEVRVSPSALKDGQLDRTYTPVMPLGDGRALAVYSDYLLLDPAFGRTTIEFEGLPARQGLMQVGHQRLTSEDPPGFFLLGSPSVERFGDDALIVDQSLPAPLMKQIRALMDQGSRQLASLPRPGGPISILAMGGGGQGKPSWRGDVSPGLIRLGFYGQGWGSADPALARVVAKFVLHERFHLHNMRLRSGAPAGVFLLEGGADAVALGLQHQQGQLDDAAYLGQLNLSLQQCQLSTGSTLRDKEFLGGDLPYHCGLVLVSLASWAASGSVLDSRQPARLWQATLKAVGDGPYDWHDFLAAARQTAVPGRQGVIELLEQLVHDRLTLQDALAAPAWRGLLQPASQGEHEVPALSSEFASRTLMSLLERQCTGPYGFHLEDGIFTLDTAQARCKAAWPDRFPVARLNGLDFVRQGWQAAQSVWQSCKEKGEVQIADAQQARTLTLPCPDIGAVPRLYRLVPPEAPASGPT
ncbi:hypothetical protein H5407_00515 [Mitsuaria sp. WAJ17]|uniref:hypothetical protein n=1 Tax=Mitsuaria sp. WAJ17 TaxID=2761452 RepID=UPI001601BFFF|nr:hypothetical protein [Mitsuaria sp. WAJ17]MBB2483701.1 hypothetical protein [Mitsuaria sp. WAJ17]